MSQPDPNTPAANTPPADAAGVNPQTQESQTSVTKNPNNLAKISGVQAGLNDKFSKLLYSVSEKYSKNTFLKFNGKENIKISIFLVNKFLYSENKDVKFDWNIESKSRNIIELLYCKDVEQLYIEDSLDEIGLRGSLLLKCEGSRFQGFLENYMQYDLIIGITLLDNNKKILLEPYIFNVTKIEQISKTTDQNKRFIISFLDILSYIAATHNFASIRKLCDGALTSAQNYETLFNIIYDYLISFLQRFTLGAYTYNKINFLENSKVDTSQLVKMTINKIGQNATIYEALKQIQYDACTPITINSEKFKSIEHDFELIEESTSALVPLFFRDEYILHSAPYEVQFAKNDDVKEKIASIEISGENNNIVKRSLFKRNFSMPFYFAFNSEKKIVFESLNPQIDKENKKIIENEYSCILGPRISPITRMTTKFIDMSLNNKRWKNMIFISEDQNKGDGNYLLRFNWLYNFYNTVLLGQTGRKLEKVCNILPDFYINEVIGLSKNKIKKDTTTTQADTGSTNQTQSDNSTKEIELMDKDFHEYNANTFLIRSEDVSSEIQYYIGKMLASFVLLNTSYVYNVEGSLFRRPNEIVKINRHIDNISFVDPNSTAPSVINAKAKDMMVYITNVKHIFKGTTYINEICSNKVCDSIK